MYVKQISVFIENTPGRLAHFTKLLGDNNIDLVSLSVADTPHFEMCIRDRCSPPTTMCPCIMTRWSRRA